MRRSRLALVAPLALLGVVVPTSVASAAPPPNDMFANATPITLDFTEVVDTTEATADDPEDAAGFECGAPRSRHRSGIA